VAVPQQQFNHPDLLLRAVHVNDMIYAMMTTSRIDFSRGYSGDNKWSSRALNVV